MYESKAVWHGSNVAANIEISEKGCLKVTGTRDIITPSMAEFIVNNAATLVEVINSSQYKTLLLNKNKAKSEAALAKALGKIASKGLSAEQVLESMGFVRK